jgi:hypothetical protein
MSDAKKLVQFYPPSPPTLNKQSQEGQGMQGCIRKDHTTDAREAPNGCDEWDGKGVNKPIEGEGTGRGKLRGMGMIGRWMEVGAHLGIKIKLTIGSPSGFPSDAY